MTPDIVCFGETLWDVFPDGKRIGGAPLNVASRLSSLGLKVGLISSVGKDRLGKKIKTYLQEKGISSNCLQSHPDLPTGTVTVSLDTNGSATYKINSPVAWDRINEDPKAVQIVKTSSIFIYGSLSSRDPVSFNTLTKLLNKATFKAFDLNLRPPHYSKETLEKLLRQADLLKINDEELDVLCGWYEIDKLPVEEQLQKISEMTSTPAICLTLGAKGAILLSEGSIFKCLGFKVEIADTVGAGDSFLAGLVYQLLNNTPKLKALRFACALGALVASKKGANARVHPDEIESLLNSQK
ncbi:carbohydrate kinase family protein [Lutimonas zeaxanthinifaciens]|uniref:carbohydrate kinase family protein n=1 Tax=Lutimonas zeaxanthinifaciens TaxID=3060215 RepID=UPI00265CC609|nr:carbohydrate kinase [Lutimonas sp. YSD2104]WKK66978.1 carbohydrate kinase [Lutimonas sp. YSD2104]